MTDIMDHARKYVADLVPGIDTATIPDDAIRASVDGFYDGGWDAFRRFWETPLVPEKVRVKTEADHYRELVAIMPYRERQKYRLGIHDEVLAFGESWNDEESVQTIMAMIRVAEVEVRSRRDHIKSTTTRLLTMTTYVETGIVKVEVFDTPDPEPEIGDFVRWGRIRDAARVESDTEQLETCYRPGTHKTPLAGWVARLELSWEQAHESEGFQDPIKEDK